MEPALVALSPFLLAQLTASPVPPNGMEGVVPYLLAQGPLGAFILILGYALWGRDRELTAERKARVDDATEFRKTALMLQAGALETANKFASTAEKLTDVAEKLSSAADAFSRRPR